MATSENVSKKFPDDFNSFEEFYPFYLHEHRNPVCKVLHFVGTSLVLVTLAWILFTGNWSKIWLLPLVGYSFAWVGHFGFEKNRPATFKWPLYSLRADFVMFFQILTRRTLVLD